MATTPTSPFLKWVGAATAIVSLLLGGRQLINVAVERAERARQAEARQREAAESVAIARQQASRREYADAWRSLNQADERAKTDASGDTRLEIAFQWLQEARAPAGQSFSGITDQVLPSLDRALLDAQHPRRADILAHLGWATYLRSRDASSTDPDGMRTRARALYEQALAIDRANPYANAMLGHLMLGTGASLDSTRPYFDAAVASGKERALVRRFQIAALRNRNGDAADAELLRVATAMREQHEMPELTDARMLYAVYRMRYAQRRSPDPRAVGVSPDDQRATFTWLTHMPGVSDRPEVDEQIIAALRAGDVASAAR
jgi:hypothetical protein